ncbi:acyltransferase family protein [Mesorhizobium australicum]|uniref:acyltransferase family protein n=1 Tax=Mesorhizobium australicum TaxID=536018 RepID=UPI0015939142|nr:acyltransferase [Mesorhizobium australicum]
MAKDLITAQQAAAVRADGPVRFEALDSWRGLAAVFIILFHAQVASHVRDASLVRAGEMFVDFFFVLSGFVIAHAYSGRLSTGADFGRFMVLRVGRVFPLHLVMLILFILMETGKSLAPSLGAAGDAAFTGTNDILAIPTNVILLHVGTHDQLTWNTPAWSIAAEMVAYVAFGLAALLLGRFLWMAAVAGAVLSGWSLWAFAPHGMESTYDFGDLRAIYGLSVGVLAYRLAVGGAARSYSRAAVGQGGVNPTLLEIAAIFLALGFVSYAYRTPAAFAAPFVFALVVLVFAAERGGVSAILRTRPFVAVGLVSFSIYMVHMFLVMRVTNVARLADKLTGTNMVVPMGHGGEGVDLGNPFAGDLLVLAIVGLTIAVSLVTYRAIEQPGRDWFRRQADRLFSRKSESVERVAPSRTA